MKQAEKAVQKVEKKVEHAAKQVVHDIINAGQNAERTVRQVGKNIEKSVHEFSKHPLESTMEFARGAGDAALADVTFNFVQQRSYNSKHPVAYEAGQMVGHAVWTIGGIKVTEISSAIGVGGAAVSLSGGGAFAGVPAMAAGAAGMTVGGVMMKTGITNFSKSASDLSQQLSRSEGVSGKAVKGTGNSLPSYGQKSVPMDPYREVYGFPVKVKPGAQEKHIPNTPNYKQEIANGKNKSIFYGDNRTAQELLDKFAGKGELLSNGKRERVDFGKPIGKYYDIKTGNYIETTRGIIHYGKDGAHIVPSEPLKK
nr:polymorphic toxin type 50 domain-containing protein [Anoxybacillus amylolyticus]